MICGNDKTQKEIDKDFKIWKKEKLKSVTHLVELENASNLTKTHAGEPNDPTTSNDINENVAKSHDRHAEDDYNTDIGSSLWESKDGNMDENGIKLVSRHGHKHEAKLRKSKNVISENTRKHRFRHDNDQTGYATTRKNGQKSRSVTYGSNRGDSDILANKRKGIYGQFIYSTIIKHIMQINY